MLDDFFLRALVAGIGVALVAGPFGCLVVWRRLAYFGDTLAHSALLGVALAILFQINLILAVFALSAAVALLLTGLQRKAGLSSDALLGLLAHASLALGLIGLSLMGGSRVDLLGFLFGDILTVSGTEIAMIYGGGLAVLALLAAHWRALFAATVDIDLARAEGLAPDRANLVFTLAMAGIIAIAMKVVGALLITALLIIPAAAARRFATGPEQMALLASLIGMVAVVAGLFGSLTWDTPSGPSIVVAAVGLFALALAPAWRRNRRGKSSTGRSQP